MGPVTQKSVFAPPGHRLLREEVYEHLRNKLKEGKLKPGTFTSIRQRLFEFGKKD